MNTQSETVRKYVLNSLESSAFGPGSRLPGSRKISEHLNISRPVVQSALDTLVNEGLLRSVSRSGLYVDDYWKSRCVKNSLRIFRKGEFLPWMPFFRSYAAEYIPELHITTCCEKGAFEIVTTAVAQSHSGEFADLRPVLEMCYPDLSSFHAGLLKPFTRQGKVTALPFLFSPRIMACNKKMLRQAGCPLPSESWSLKEFSEIVSKLRQHYPPEKIFFWTTGFFCWMSFVLSGGGRLFCVEKQDPVCFDSPETIETLTFFRSLRCKHPAGVDNSLDCSGFVFSIIDRQMYSLNRQYLDEDFLFLPMPGRSPEYTGCSMQATELLVMRKERVENELCAKLIRFLWSEEFQQHLEELHYGIPVMKDLPENAGVTAADVMFHKVLARLDSSYHISSPDIFRLVSCGISSILEGEGNVREELGELASTVRNYLKYTQTSLDSNPK